MEIAKPSEEDKEFFLSLVPEGVRVRPMFGNLAAFINDHMFMGLFGPDVGLRLSEEDREALLAEEGAGSFGPAGRPMKEYVSIPRRWRDSPEAAAAWIERALAYATSLPPKAKKKRFIQK